jgi:DNA-binding protein Fis
VSEDLILEAYRVSRETASRAAALLAIPETTFRRRLHKALARTGSGMSPRPEGWAPLRAAISRLVEAGNPARADLLEQVRLILLEEVTSKLAQDVKRASALMGVSEPTYRRWSEEIATNA